jgi:hypothetical protein
MKSFKSLINMYFPFKWKKKLNSEFATRYLIAARLVLPAS